MMSQVIFPFPGTKIILGTIPGVFLYRCDIFWGTTMVPFFFIFVESPGELWVNGGKEEEAGAGGGRRMHRLRDGL